jgi:hypothetical protein
MIRLPVILVGGLAGVGKSTASAWISEDLALLHYEIDLPGADGIERHDLRREWNEFYGRCHSAPLSVLLQARATASGKNGAILSFPSSAVFRHGHISAAVAAGIQVVVLVGTVDHCLNAFLERERASGRGFDADWWHQFNDDAAALYGGAGYESVRIEAFRPDGSRLPRGDIVELVRKRTPASLTLQPTAARTPRKRRSRRRG